MPNLGQKFRASVKKFFHRAGISGDVHNKASSSEEYGTCADRGTSMKSDIADFEVNTKCTAPGKPGRRPSTKSFGVSPMQMLPDPGAALNVACDDDAIQDKLSASSGFREDTTRMDSCFEKAPRPISPDPKPDGESEVERGSPPREKECISDGESSKSSTSEIKEQENNRDPLQGDLVHTDADEGKLPRKNNRGKRVVSSNSLRKNSSVTAPKDDGSECMSNRSAGNSDNLEKQNLSTWDSRKSLTSGELPLHLQDVITNEDNVQTENTGGTTLSRRKKRKLRDAMLSQSLTSIDVLSVLKTPDTTLPKEGATYDLEEVQPTSVETSEDSRLFEDTMVATVSPVAKELGPAGRPDNGQLEADAKDCSAYPRTTCDKCTRLASMDETERVRASTATPRALNRGVQTMIYSSDIYAKLKALKNKSMAGSKVARDGHKHKTDDLIRRSYKPKSPLDSIRSEKRSHRKPRDPPLRYEIVWYQKQNSKESTGTGLPNRLSSTGLRSHGIPPHPRGACAHSKKGLEGGDNSHRLQHDLLAQFGDGLSRRRLSHIARGAPFEGRPYVAAPYRTKKSPTVAEDTECRTAVNAAPAEKMGDQQPPEQEDTRQADVTETEDHADVTGQSGVGGNFGAKQSSLSPDSGKKPESNEGLPASSSAKPGVTAVQNEPKSPQQPSQPATATIFQPIDQEGGKQSTANSREAHTPLIKRNLVLPNKLPSSDSASQGAAAASLLMKSPRSTVSNSSASSTVGPSPSSVKISGLMGKTNSSEGGTQSSAAKPIRANNAKPAVANGGGGGSRPPSRASSVLEVKNSAGRRVTLAQGGKALQPATNNASAGVSNQSATVSMTTNGVRPPTQTSNMRPSSIGSLKSANGGAHQTNPKQAAVGAKAGAVPVGAAHSNTPISGVSAATQRDSNKITSLEKSNIERNDNFISDKDTSSSAGKNDRLAEIPTIKTDDVHQSQQHKLKEGGDKLTSEGSLRASSNTSRDSGSQVVTGAPAKPSEKRESKPLLLISHESQALCDKFRQENAKVEAELELMAKQTEDSNALSQQAEAEKQRKAGNASDDDRKNGVAEHNQTDETSIVELAAKANQIVSSATRANLQSAAHQLHELARNTNGRWNESESVKHTVLTKPRQSWQIGLDSVSGKLDTADERQGQQSDEHNTTDEYKAKTDQNVGTASTRQQLVIKTADKSEQQQTDVASLKPRHLGGEEASTVDEKPSSRGALPAATTKEMDCPTGRHQNVKPEKPCVCLMVKKLVLYQMKPVISVWHSKIQYEDDDVKDKLLDDERHPPLTSYQLMRPTKLVRGGQGTVAWVCDSVTQRNYALKLKAREQRSSGTWRIERREATILRHIKHHFIVKMYHSYETEEALFMALEWLGGGCLWNHIARIGVLPEPYALYYASCVLAGLEYLHDHCIVYRDMKAENIALDTKGRPKLIDFGMAKWFASPYGNRSTNKDKTPGQRPTATSGPKTPLAKAIERRKASNRESEDDDDRDLLGELEAATAAQAKLTASDTCDSRQAIEAELAQPPTRYYFAAYLAPEIYSQPEIADHLIDSWGLGYLIVEMILGYGIFSQMPWESHPDHHLSPEWRLELPQDAHSRLSPACFNFVHRMLHREPKDRLRLVESRTHTLFSRVPWAQLDQIRGPNLAAFPSRTSGSSGGGSSAATTAASQSDNAKAGNSASGGGGGGSSVLTTAASMVTTSGAAATFSALADTQHKRVVSGCAARGSTGTIVSTLRLSSDQTVGYTEDPAFLKVFWGSSSAAAWAQSCSKPTTIGDGGPLAKPAGAVYHRQGKTGVRSSFSGGRANQTVAANNAAMACLSGTNQNQQGPKSGRTMRRHG